MKATRSGLAALALVLLASGAWAADVAILKSSESPTWRPTIDALRRAAPTHAISEFDLRGDRAEAERLLGTLKAKNAILVAMGPLAAQAAKEAAPELALIYCMVADPVRLGLTGGNATGVNFQIPVKNQLAAFRMVNPRGVRIGVIYSAEGTGKLVQEALKAAPVVRLSIVERAVASDKEVPEAMRALLKGDQAIDALWIPPDPILLGDEARRFILGETLKAGKPVYSFSSALVSEGALVSNGPDFASIGDQVGELIGRLAGGEKAGRIDALIPRAELVINKKIAEKLKIEIPKDALDAAKRVF